MKPIALACGSPGEAVDAPLARDRLGQIQVPTLLVRDRLDVPHVDSRMPEIGQRIPGATSVVVDGDAHLPGWEQPLAFNGALARHFVEPRAWAA